MTRDGEYLGTWDTDETYAFYQFTPDGEQEPMFSDAFRGIVCEQIEKWTIDRQSGLDLDQG